MLFNGLCEFHFKFYKKKTKVSGRLYKETDTLIGSGKGNWVQRGQGARVPFHHMPCCN